MTFQYKINEFQTFQFLAPTLVQTGSLYTYRFSIPTINVGWVDTPRGVHVGTDSRFVIPVEAMPEEKMKDGVEIIGALDEQPIGASRPWRHQRTSR